MTRWGSRSKPLQHLTGRSAEGFVRNLQQFQESQPAGSEDRHPQESGDLTFVHCLSAAWVTRSKARYFGNIPCRLQSWIALTAGTMRRSMPNLDRPHDSQRGSERSTTKSKRYADMTFTLMRGQHTPRRGKGRAENRNSQGEDARSRACDRICSGGPHLTSPIAHLLQHARSSVSRELEAVDLIISLSIAPCML